MGHEINELNEISVDEDFTPVARGAQRAAEVLTADGEFYDRGEIYFYFESQSARVRESAGLRLVGEHLCRFGAKVVAVRHLHANRDGAIDAAKKHFKAEITRLEKQINELEAQKTGEQRKLKNFALVGDNRDAEN